MTKFWYVKFFNGINSLSEHSMGHWEKLEIFYLYANATHPSHPAAGPDASLNE